MTSPGTHGRSTAGSVAADVAVTAPQIREPSGSAGCDVAGEDTLLSAAGVVVATTSGGDTGEATSGGFGTVLSWVGTVAGSGVGVGVGLVVGVGEGFGVGFGAGLVVGGGEGFGAVLVVGGGVGFGSGDGAGAVLVVGVGDGFGSGDGFGAELVVGVDDCFGAGLAVGVGEGFGVGATLGLGLGSRTACFVAGLSDCSWSVTLISTSWPGSAVGLCFLASNAGTETVLPALIKVPGSPLAPGR